MSKKTPQYPRVLAWVNRMRKNLHKKPVTKLQKGIMGDNDDCTIARSIGTNMGYQVPAYIGDFMEKFDLGKIPHLVKK